MVPCAEKTILVVLRTPEQICTGALPLVAVGVPFLAALLPLPPDELMAEAGLHWNAVFCERSGASDRLSAL